MILPAHQRMAMLWTAMQRRQLTDDEAVELHHCHAANARYCWEMSYLENMSLLASIAGNLDWQYEICQAIDELQLTGQRKKSGKSPDQK